MCQNFQMTIDYAQHTHQKLIIVQLEFETTCDYFNWSFVFRLMDTMGFGPCMCHFY